MNDRVDNQVFAEQVAILHRLSPLSLATTAVATPLVVMLLYGSVALPTLLAWAVLMLVVTFIRLRIVQRFRSTDEWRSTPQPWMRDFCTGACAAGLTWGAAAALFLPAADFGPRFALLSLMAVVPALSISSLGAHRIAVNLFVLSMLVPMAATLLYIGDRIHVALAIATVVYSAVLWVMGQRAHVSTVGGLTQGFEKEALLEQVSAAREAAERARAAAEDANRAKSMFLATMSHEIRTPMNGVLGMTELLQRTELTPRQKHFADTVQRSAIDLLAIINDILDFSKVEAGRLELETVPVDVRQLASEILAMLADSAVRQENVLHGEFDPRLAPMLRADPTRLRQVLVNLLGNAVKFTHAGEVCLRIDVEGDDSEGQMLRFSVSDTGIGIEPDAQARLFRAFSQADGSTTRQYGGTGLGLAIARELVALMGGEIGVLSAPGEGSTFHVRVRFPRPVADATSPAVVATPPEAAAQQPAPMARGAPGTAADEPAKEPTTARCRVLLAEDNQVNRLVATEMLQVLGCEVATAANGEDATQQWRRGEFDLMFMDCQMPIMDGLAAARCIRAEELARGVPAHTPIVALTANALLSDRDDCVAAGMDDHLAKPFSIAELDAAIMRWTGTQWQRKQAADRST